MTFVTDLGHHFHGNITYFIVSTRGKATTVAVHCMCYAEAFTTCTLRWKSLGSPIVSQTYRITEFGLMKCKSTTFDGKGREP